MKLLRLMMALAIVVAVSGFSSGAWAQGGTECSHGCKPRPIGKGV